MSKYLLNLKKNRNSTKGFSLIEVLVSLMLISILMISVYSLVTISLKVTVDNASYIEAINYANQKMENIRNLPYDDVGTILGFPAGAIPQVETIDNYTINNYVIYYDDVYDGFAGADTNSIVTDYKIVTVKISWKGKFDDKSLSVFSKIIPRTIETSAGAGLLIISVVDAFGLPIQGADVRIINNVIIPAIDQTSLTNADGKLYYPAPEALLPSYEIIVTKVGYGTDRSNDQISGLSPVHLKVLESDKTEELFVIDKLATMNIKTVSDNMQDNFQVSTTTGNNNIAVQGSIDSSDNLYFAWQEEIGANSKVNLQKFNSLGVKQWTVNATTSDSNFQTNPDIATTTAGNSFVVWQDNSVSMKLLANGKKMNTFACAKPSKFLEEKFNLDYGLDVFSFYSSNIYNSTLAYTDHKNVQYSFDNLLNTFSDNFVTPEALAATTVSFVSFSEASQSGRYIQITKPFSIIEDDLLLAYIHFDDAGDGPTLPPAGWSTLYDDLNPNGGDSDSKGGIFWKFASASEPSDYTFMLSKNRNEEKAGTIRAYRGVNLLTPFEGALQYVTTPDNNQ